MKSPQLWSSLPVRVRRLAPIAAFALAHLVLPGPVETARLAVLGLVLRTLPPLGRVGDGAAAASAGRERFEAVAAVALAPYHRLEGPLLPVLDVDLAAGFVLVGGGLDAGVRRGALALAPGGACGVVDRVLENVARITLLTRKGTRLPIEVAPDLRELPGRLTGLFGVIEGHGSGATVVLAQLPEGFRSGDRLWTVPDEEGRTWSVGWIEGSGVRPAVKLDVDPEGLPLVHVEGGSRAIARESLFEDVRCGVALVERPPCGAAYLREPGTKALAAGSAVEQDGRYLTRLTTAGAGIVLVSTLEDPAHTLRALVVDAAGRSARATLRPRAPGIFTVERWSDAAPADGPVAVFTAGGEELIPAGLEVAADAALAGGRLRAAEPPPWPRAVTVRRFRFAEQRERLLRR